MTGQEFDKIFDQATDKAYSAYLDNTKKARLYKMALFEAVESKYREVVNQKRNDELNFLISTNHEVEPVNNEFEISKLVVTNITFGFGIVSFTTQLPHNLTNGDTVTISDVVGTGALPGDLNDLTTTVLVTGTNTFTIALATSGTYTSGGLIEKAVGMVGDYMHLFAIRTMFRKQNASNINSVSTSYINFTTNQNFKTGQKVWVDGVTLLSGLIGYRYIKRIGPKKFQLFTNEAMDIPITTSGVYVADSCEIYVVNEYWAKPYDSDRKFSVFAKPKVNNPYFEEADGKMKIYPSDETCNYAYLDYVRQPDIFIDPTDSSIDLEQYYPQKFLYYIVDVAVRLFAGPTRDQFLYQTSQAEIVNNP